MGELKVKCVVYSSLPVQLFDRYSGIIDNEEYSMYGHDRCEVLG